MKRLVTIIVALIATLGMNAQISDDILDSLVNEVQQGKTVDNVEPADDVEATANHRILAVGDEMLETIGPRLYNYACANGYSIFTEIWQGSKAENWAYTTELPRLIKKLKPTYVIVCLGTHDLAAANPSGSAAAVGEMLREIGDIPFIWIGPISLKAVARDPGIVNMIRENVGADRFYDSYHLKLQRFPDGIHPTFEASAHWIDGVARWMSGPEARHPIVMEYPRTTAQQFKHDERHQTKYKGTNKNTGKTNTLR